MPAPQLMMVGKVAAAGAAAVSLAAAAVLTTEASHDRKAAAQPPRFLGLPRTLAIGSSDKEGGAAALLARAPFAFRYHYLAGGANTGAGWQSFARGGGSFVPDFISDSRAHGMVPAFSYYMLLQSRPGNAQRDERKAIVENLANPATMSAYLRDLRAFFVRARAATARPVLLHVEPDLWGYAERSSRRNSARTVRARISGARIPLLRGLPDDVSGLARAIVRLRNRYAPNVRLGYHVSIWGTGVDLAENDPSARRVDQLAVAATRFYRTLGARFDALFFEFANRDAGYREFAQHDGRAGWWTPADFARHVRFIGRMTSALKRPAVLWQIPLGNTVMRAVDNTRGHYADNRVQWLLGERSGRVHQREYARAGVVALLFGPALPGATCACDAERDGVTNPPPAGTHTRLSYSADDDGGYFAARVRRYSRAPLPLPRARR